MINKSIAFKYLLLVSLIGLFFSRDLSAQIYDPVKWSYATEYKGDNIVELVFTATIEDGWHIYGTEESGIEYGPIKTSFFFDSIDGVKFIGPIQSRTKVIEKYDKVFQAKIKYYENKAVFSQKAELTRQVSNITGEGEFMVCDDSKCLPPDNPEFSFNIKANYYKAPSTGSKESPKETKKTAEVKKPVDEPGTFGFTVKEAGKDKKIEEEKEEKNDPSSGLVPAMENQILDPVDWEFAAEKTGENTYRVKLTARIQKGWHIYAMTVPEGEFSPIPTTFNFKNQKGLNFEGNIKPEREPIKELDQTFEMELPYYKKDITFFRDFSVTGDVKKIEGDLEYMVCDDSRCLPPEIVEFSISLAEASLVSAGDNTIGDGKKKDEKSGALTGIFIAGFLGGLVALVTPCVFPMIPLTVSFFTKKDSKGGLMKALLYGLSIIGIYVLLGLLITVTLGSDALNNLASNAYMNLAFFFIFIIFAISFFGAFELTLPSSFINKVDSASDKGGLIGIFFMAFTLVLVSFSCTGPIIGTLLVEAAVKGNLLGPAIGMAGFSFALALPFGLFAAFPSWLNSLPKSGGWLNSVKVVLGFLELALALKFLSVVDLAYHWNILSRDVFLALWIIIFSLLGFYLLGKLQFSHDSPVTQISIPRLFFAILAFSFSAYLLPGLFGAPVSLVSGIAPPSSGQDFNLHNYQYKFEKLERELAELKSSGGNFTSSEGIVSTTKERYGKDLFHCPHELNCFFDLNEGLAYARKVNKPVMIDFTGHSCVNCRKMEDNVWPKPGVYDMLSKEYVIVSLYVDDKTELPDSEQYVSDFSGKKIITVGNKWSDLQATEFRANSQPYYVLLDPNHEEPLETPLLEPRGYTPDSEQYKEFLVRGLDLYQQKNNITASNY